MTPDEWKHALGADVWALIADVEYESFGDGNTDTDSADNVARILDAAHDAGVLSVRVTWDPCCSVCVQPASKCKCGPDYEGDDDGTA